MNAKSILVAFSVLAIALAGCSDDPPSGELSNARSGLSIDGDVTLEYQAANNPYPYAGTELEAIFACQPDQIAGPAGQETCSQPYSLVNAHIMSIPAPSTDGYKLVYTSSAGDEREIGALMDEGGMYSLNQSFEEDLSSFEEIQIRMGAVSVASAMNAAGTQSFAANESLLGVDVTGAWSGKKLDINVAGLPAAPGGVAFVGWLVTVDDAGVKTHEEQFPIAGDGELVYDATKNLSNFDELHIHLGSSQVNLVIVDL